MLFEVQFFTVFHCFMLFNHNHDLWLCRRIPPRFFRRQWITYNSFTNKLRFGILINYYHAKVNLTIVCVITISITNFFISTMTEARCKWSCYLVSSVWLKFYVIVVNTLWIFFWGTCTSAIVLTLMIPVFLPFYPFLLLL